MIFGIVYCLICIELSAKNDRLDRNTERLRRRDLYRRHPDPADPHRRGGVQLHPDPACGRDHQQRDHPQGPGAHAQDLRSGGCQ